MEGQPPKGEAALEFQEIVVSGQRYAERAVEQERIPADLKEIPLKYFEHFQGDDE